MSAPKLDPDTVATLEAALTWSAERARKQARATRAMIGSPEVTGDVEGHAAKLDRFAAALDGCLATLKALSDYAELLKDESLREVGS